MSQVTYVTMVPQGTRRYIGRHIGNAPVCNPSKVIPAVVTGGDDVATRKYKSTCGDDSGSFKVK